MVRLTGSLLQGRVPASGIVRTLQVGDNSTRLAQGIPKFGRIDKTLDWLRYIDNKNMRQATLTQLNRIEGRHSVARVVFSGKRGELRRRYRDGRKSNSAHSGSSSVSLCCGIYLMRKQSWSNSERKVIQ